MFEEHWKTSLTSSEKVTIDSNVVTEAIMAKKLDREHEHPSMHAELSRAIEKLLGGIFHAVPSGSATGG